jgi:hypothetical protein
MRAPDAHSSPTGSDYTEQQPVTAKVIVGSIAKKLSSCMGTAGEVKVTIQVRENNTLQHVQQLHLNLALQVHCLQQQHSIACVNVDAHLTFLIQQQQQRCVCVCMRAASCCTCSITFALAAFAANIPLLYHLPWQDRSAAATTTTTSLSRSVRRQQPQSRYARCHSTLSQLALLTVG